MFGEEECPAPWGKKETSPWDVQLFGNSRGEKKGRQERIPKGLPRERGGSIRYGRCCAGVDEFSRRKRSS